MRTTVQFLDPLHGRLLPQQVFQHGLHLLQVLLQLGGLAALVASLEIQRVIIAPSTVHGSCPSPAKKVIHNNCLNSHYF